MPNRPSCWPPEDLFEKLSRLRERGLDFEEAWALAVRPEAGHKGRKGGAIPAVTVGTPELQIRHPDAVIWPNDTEARATWRAAIEETREEWRAAYLRIPSRRGEALLVLVDVLHEHGLPEDAAA